MKKLFLVLIASLLVLTGCSTGGGKASGTLTVARPVKKIDKAAVYLTKVRLKLKIYFSLKIIFYS